MEEAVCCKNQEYLFAVSSQQSQCQGKKQAVGKACLSDGVESQVERIYARKKCENTLDNPGDVRDNATYHNPLQWRFVQSKPSQWRLYSDMG